MTSGWLSRSSSWKSQLTTRRRNVALYRTPWLARVEV